MEKLSSDPKGLNVSDLQLLWALWMRQGVDLTAFLNEENELSFSPTESVRMTAKFDKFGFLKEGIKYVSIQR